MKIVCYFCGEEIKDSDLMDEHHVSTTKKVPVHTTCHIKHHRRIICKVCGKVILPRKREAHYLKVHPDKPFNKYYMARYYDYPS